MQRFILQQNITLYQHALQTEPDTAVRHRIGDMLGSAQRELAMLEATLFGVQTKPPWTVAEHGNPAGNGGLDTQFRDQFTRSSSPYMLLSPGSGLQIVDINDAYGRATMITRAAVVGRPLFEVFPDNPSETRADGVHNLYASLRAAAESGQPNAMPIQRYDVRDTAGKFVQRHWRPINTPLFDQAGRLTYLLHHVEDVTADITRTQTTP
jgi:PAS domain-containing protein